MPPHLLSDIKIVLVNPLYGGNIGSSMRALATMGLRRLCLVSPQNFPCKETRIFAANAKALLEEVEVCDTLDAAIADCTLVVGTSARNRRLSPKICDLRSGVSEIIAHANSHEPTDIAILFGSEDRGLENNALDKCRMHLLIDTDPEYPSLNLAAAVQILCYELRRRAREVFDGAERRDEGKASPSLANQASMENFYGHLEEWLHRIQFFNPQRPATIMRKMRLIFGRIGLYANEVEMLRGMLTNSLQLIARANSNKVTRQRKKKKEKI